MPDLIPFCDPRISIFFPPYHKNKSVTSMEKVCPIYVNTVVAELQHPNLTKAVNNSSVSCYR